MQAATRVQAGMKPLTGHMKPTHFTPLFLTTTRFISKERYVVTQDYAGESAAEVLGFLAKKFSQIELMELAQGVPVDSSDGDYQYHLRSKLLPKELGLLPKRAPKPKPLKGVVMAEAKGWGNKIKKLREEAGLSQVAVTKKIAPGFFNIMTNAELESRKFSPDERKKFFTLLGKPEDNGIPVADEAELSRRHVAKVRVGTHRNNVTKAAARKAVKAVKKPTKKTLSKELKAPKKKPKQKPEPRVQHAVATVPQHLSPIKQAALQDFASTITNPNLPDSKAQEIMALFKSLAITVLLK
jgi:hypothetical protein